MGTWPRRLPARLVRGRASWKMAALAAVVIAGLAVPIGAGTATAATVRTGTLALSPQKATAGDTADVFTFTYTSPAKPMQGTISIDVPAGFSTPQTTSPGHAGFL